MRVNITLHVRRLSWFMYGPVPWRLQAFKWFVVGRLTAYPHNQQDVPLRLTPTASPAQQTPLYR